MPPGFFRPRRHAVINHAKSLRAEYRHAMEYHRRRHHHNLIVSL